MESISNGKAFMTLSPNSPQEDEDIREGVLVLHQDGVWVQRYFTVYDARMFFSFRGREKTHLFSPLTIVSPVESQFAENHYPFRLETDNQPTFFMAAPTRTDLNDWTAAIRSEVTKMINGIMQPYLSKGFGTIEKKSLSNLVDEGCFASYAFRKQGSQIVPIFLALESNRLTCFRASREREKVGRWDISSDTTVEILEAHAAPAFKIDKESLIVDSLSTRASWILALKQSVERVKSHPKSKVSGVDFGAPQAVPPNTIRMNSVEQASAEDFYRTFAGSVRISGTVRIDSQNEFNTLQINDTDDDGQEKFRNLKFEFETDDAAEDVLSALDAGMLSSTDSNLASSMENLSLTASQSEESIPDSRPPSERPADIADNPLLAAFIPPSAEGEAKQDVKSVTLKRQPRRMTKTNSSDGVMRVKLKSKLPEGPIKVYGGALNGQEPFKTIVISSETTTQETIGILLGKYNISKNNINQYILVEEEIGGQNISRVLDEYESPLIVKLNWDHRSMRFAIYLKETTIQNPASSNYFMVKCMDGAGATVKFNEHLSVGRICELTGQNINLQKSSLPCFSLWLISDDFELQLEPTQQFRIIAQDWPQLRKRFLPDAPTDVHFQIIYRRWAFLALTAERRCKDPAAIQMLYEQARSMVVSGLYPCNEQDSVSLAALSAKLTFGPYNENFHTPGFLIEHTNDLKSIVSAYTLRQTGFKVEEFERRIYDEYARHKDHTDMICQLLYLQISRRWPYYGSTFFLAKLLTATGKGSKRRHYIDDNKHRATTVRVGVSVESLSIIDVLRNNVLFSQNLDTISVLSDFGSNCFVFETHKIRNDGVNSTTEKEITMFVLFTTQASLLENFVTSCKRQRMEDERALKALRNLQRPRSKTDAVQRAHGHLRAHSTS